MTPDKIADPAADGAPSNLLQSFDTTVRASGDGRTRAEAFQACVKSMRTTVMADHREEAVLQMEPIACRAIQATQSVGTERFFGVLFPRRIESFALVVEFTVRMKVVDLDALPVTRSTDTRSVGTRILDMR